MEMLDLLGIGRVVGFKFTEIYIHSKKLYNLQWHNCLALDGHFGISLGVCGAGG